MKIIMLSALTGNGHNAVMESIYSYLDCEKNEIELFPSFYEDLLPSNKIMSDFYNLLQISSFEMCKLYTQMSTLKSKAGIEKESQYWSKPLDEFFTAHPCDVVISATPLINQYIVNYLKDSGRNVKFYIVVTDPFDPIYPGFAVKGAEKYFVPNKIVADILLAHNIDSERIVESGYPISKKFIVSTDASGEIQEHKAYDKCKKTLLINCGAQGSYHYVSIVEKVYEAFHEQFNIVVICGKNKVLYNLFTRKYNIVVLGYVLNMRCILNLCDLCITKAGANTFYECLFTETPLLVDATKGLLYQEEGVADFLNVYPVGSIFNSLAMLKEIMQQMTDEGYLSQWKSSCHNLKLHNGSKIIVDSIMNQSESGGMP